MMIVTGSSLILACPTRLAGARQPSKKLAQIIIGDERAASELARHKAPVADRGVYGLRAHAGQHARLYDGVRAAPELKAAW
jgi:hypothetical protein